MSIFKPNYKNKVSQIITAGHFLIQTADSSHSSHSLQHLLCVTTYFTILLVHHNTVSHLNQEMSSCINFCLYLGIYLFNRT